jgi:protease PrsW
MTLSFSTIAIIIALAVIPAIVWSWVYRILDRYDEEPLMSIFTTLVVGIVSTLPVFALQYLFKTFPKLDFLSFLQANIHDTFFFSLAFLAFVAIIEEFVKAIGTIISAENNERDFNQVVDGIVYAASVGLGFAMAENVYYFFSAVQNFGFSGNFYAIFAIRSFGTMLAHTLFTGAFGFYFAKAYFAPFIIEDSKNERLWHNWRHNIRQAVKLHTTFFHLLPSVEGDKEHPAMSRNAIIFEGMFIAVILHFIYNILIKVQLFGQYWTFLIVPMVFLMAWYLWSKFFVRVYTRIINFVRTKRGTYKVKIT